MTNRLAEIKKYIEYWENPSFLKPRLTSYHCEAIAQIKWLISEIEYLKKCNATQEQTISDYVGKKVGQLSRRVKKLEAALKYYAEKENWNEGDMELGERARKALEE